MIIDSKSNLQTALGAGYTLSVVTGVNLVDSAEAGVESNAITVDAE